MGIAARTLATSAAFARRYLKMTPVRNGWDTKAVVCPQEIWRTAIPMDYGRVGLAQMTWGADGMLRAGIMIA
jgi:hypothetical protein